MRKLFLLIALLCSIASAEAWTRDADQGVRLYAREHLSKRALSEYRKLLQLNRSVPYEKGAEVSDKRWNKVSLDADLRSTTTFEGDVVVQLEQAAEVLRNRASHSNEEVVKALRSVWYNIIRLHTISLVRIEGNAKSEGFTIYYSGGEMAALEPKYKPRASSWSKLWSRDATIGFYGYTIEMFAEEIRICHGADKEAFSKGTIRDWAADMGRECAAQLEWASPDMTLYSLDRTNLGVVTDRLMAKAAFRMAALLNEVLQ